MKILFLSDDFPPTNFGGAGIVAYNLAKAIKKLGHDVYVITTTQDKNTERDYVQDDGLKVFNIYSKYHPRWRAYLSLYNPQTVKKISKIIADIKPDVTHAHNVHIHLSYYVLKIAKEFSGRVILTAHDAMLYEYGKAEDELRVSWRQQLRENRLRYNPFRNIVIKYYLRFVDKIIAVSNSLQRALENNGIKNVMTIHNSINLDDWIVSDDLVSAFKKRYSLEDKKTILVSGRLSGAKGVGKLVEALVLVVKNIPQAVLVIAGREDGSSQTMGKITQTKNLQKHIVFTGWISHDEMKIAYYAVNLAVTPSLYLDPFVLVNLEAMAAKKPVVGTCFGGTSEIVVNNETGYIVDPNDVNALSDRIIKLLNDETLAQKMGEKGYERAKNHFSLKQQTDKYLAIYTT